MCDRISDTLLDLYLETDPNSRCAIETCGGLGKVFITGEVTSTTLITDEVIIDIVKEITKDKNTEVIINLNSQSPEIAQGVDTGGAGDQGIMIGYACDDNQEYLPQEYYLSRELNKFIFGKYPTDGKTQVTMNGNSLRLLHRSVVHLADELEKLVMKFFRKFPQYHIEFTFMSYCSVIGILVDSMLMLIDW